jgi:serine/threonine protein kinase
MEQQALAGRYALGPRVGTGGMADVFEAHDTRLGRDVAVKIFRAGGADGIERGSAEARLLAGLDHPGLVRVLDMDTGEQPGDQAYLVMELVRGPDLGVLLRRSGPLGREDVRLLALDLARTLDYIHGRGIVHRDIKPSNVLTRPAEPHGGRFGYLLTDFGIARFFDGGRMTATGQVIGSLSYFSPEQARGDDVGQPTDIYSLGLVLIECLTGEKAFPGTGVESALVRLHRGPSIPRAAGAGLSAALMSMTLHEPGARPSAAEVVRALTALGPLQQEPRTPARPAPVGTDDTAASTSVSSSPSLPSPDSPAPGSSPADSPPLDSMSPASMSPVSSSPSDGTATAALGSHAEEGATTSEMGSTTRASQAPPASTAIRRPPASNAPETVALARSEPATRQFVQSGKAAPPPGGAASGRLSDSTLMDDTSPQTHGHPPAAGPREPASTRGTPRKRGRILPWVIALLVLVALATALWLSGVLSTGAASDVPPLPAVPGEPGERLQDLYESVQP